MDNEKLMKIFGTEELINSFVSMDKNIQNSILQSSFKKASKLLIDSARGNLAGRYSHVANSLGVSMKKNIQTLNVGAIRKKGGNLAWIANYGTKERGYTTEGGSFHKTGKVTPIYYWTNANTETEGQMEEIIYKDIKDRFLKLLQKTKTMK